MAHGDAEDIAILTAEYTAKEISAAFKNISKELLIDIAKQGPATFLHNHLQTAELFIFNPDAKVDLKQLEPLTRPSLLITFPIDILGIAAAADNTAAIDFILQEPELACDTNIIVAFHLATVCLATQAMQTIHRYSPEIDINLTHDASGERFGGLKVHTPFDNLLAIWPPAFAIDPITDEHRHTPDHQSRYVATIRMLVRTYGLTKNHDNYPSVWKAIIAHIAPMTAEPLAEHLAGVAPDVDAIIITMLCDLIDAQAEIARLQAQLETAPAATAPIDPETSAAPAEADADAEIVAAASS